VPCGKEFGEDARQKLDLTRRPDELIINHTARVDPVFDAFEQERVLTDLPELHKLIAKTLDPARFPKKRSAGAPGH
jgi:hypothetical protein